MTGNVDQLRRAVGEIANRLPLKGAVLLVRRDQLGNDVIAIGGDVMGLTGRFPAELAEHPANWASLVAVRDEARVRMELVILESTGSGQIGYAVVDSSGRALPVVEYCTVVEGREPGERGAIVGIVVESGAWAQGSGAAAPDALASGGAVAERAMPGASASDGPTFNRPETVRALLAGIAHELEEVLAAIAAETSRPPSILVVEDDESVRQLIERALLRDGYAVLAVADGAEAVEVFDGIRQGFDLLITDVVLPERTGSSLHRELRRRRPTLPALYISDHRGPGVSGDAPLGGLTGSLSAPFSPEKLRAEVGRILRAAHVGNGGEDHGEVGIRGGKSG